MSELLLPTQKPKCLNGCAHFVLIDGLNGNRHPRCMVLQMPLLMNGNELIIDVAKCPAFLSIQQAKELAEGRTTNSDDVKKGNGIADITGQRIEI